jgi:2-polyprenyl-3-methyl-5-hydroxy-6-metoxy-1,4-benzoquinol methylase
MSNSIQDLLTTLGVCDPASVVEFFPRVRDRDDISVLRCAKSEVIFLSRSDHVDAGFYAGRRDLSDWSARSRAEALRDCREDDARRARQFGAVISGKRWLDVGTGVGGLLDLLASASARACAVEPQEGARLQLRECGYEVFGGLDELADATFDVATLFHVVEHLPDPVGTLRRVCDHVVPGGKVIIEVPHARDFLIWAGLNAFREFTFWSEHLILHTRASLEAVCRAAGLEDVEVQAYQRYPVANHLHWLARGRPGGHKEWSFLSGDELDRAYQAKLAEIDRTDTLIATATRQR